MAVEKTKVLEVLSTKFKGKSLSKTFLDKLATRYATKIETDADVDDYINDREDDIIDAGTEADRRVSAALKKPKEGDKSEKKEPTEIDEDELKDAPAYVKALMTQIKGMNDEIKGFKAKEAQQTISKRFESDERLKGIPAKLLKGWYPTTEEEFEDAVTQAAEELKEFVAVEGATGSGKTFGGTDRPGFSGNQQKQAQAQTAKVPDAITQFTDRMNKSQSVNKS